MKRIVLVILIISICVLPAGCHDSGENTFESGCLTVYFFDVGQADSSLLLFPDRTVMLIDCGSSKCGENIASFISDLGIETIDYLVCTHPHDDHIGGCEVIFDEFKISTVCLPAIPSEFEPDTKIYEKLVNSIYEEKCKTLTLTADTLITDGDNYNITSVAPADGSVYSDTNDWSLCLLINYATNTLLFCGDAGEASERDMLNCKTNLDADILKVGHHGSSSASTEEFLKAVSPQAAIISSDKGNMYGHPSKSALERFAESGSMVYRTDTAGTVIAKCYDGGFNIITESSLVLEGE